MNPSVIELSHPIHHDMPVYPGLPRPEIRLHLDHADSRPTYDHQAEFAIGKISLVGNTGTYLDSPYHRYPDGPDVSQSPLTQLVDPPTVSIDARTRRGASLPERFRLGGHHLRSARSSGSRRDSPSQQRSAGS